MIEWLKLFGLIVVLFVCCLALGWLDLKKCEIMHPNTDPVACIILNR